MKAYYREKIRLLAEFGIPIMDNYCHSLIANWLDK